MTIRPYRLSDGPALAEMARESGYPYPDPCSRTIEICLVATDESGVPIAAAAEERLLQSFFWRSSKLSPIATVQIIRKIEEEMSTELKKRGYNSVEAYIHPALAKRFGRRLEKTFGWIRGADWPNWTRYF